MITLDPNSRFVRSMDRLQDLLLVFMLLGAPLIFYTKGNDVFEFNKITALRFASCLSVMIYALRLWLVRPTVITRSPLDWPILSWLVVCFIATFNTVNINLSMHGVYEDFEGITTWVNYVYLFWIVQQHVKTPRQVHMVIGSVVLAGAAAGFYGILQNFQIDFVPWDPATYSVTRMFSTMGNPNFLAAYLVMSMPITLAVFLNLPDKIKVDKYVCWVLIGLGVVGSLGLVSLFKIDYGNLDPAFYGVETTVRAFFTQKFLAAHLLPLFPLAAALLLFNGRLKLILMVSLLFQLIAIAFSKSRGGFFSIMLLTVLFIAFIIWEGYRQKGEKAAIIHRTGLAWGGLSFAGLILLIAGAILDAGIFRFGGLLFMAVGLVSAVYSAGLSIAASPLLRPNWAWFAGLVAGAAIALIAIEPIRDTTIHSLERLWKLTDKKAFSLTPRLYIWRSALQMWSDKFWFGWGLDTFQVVFSQYRTAIYWALEWNGTPEKAHNVVLQTAATMGTAGLVTFFWMLWAYAVKTWRDIRSLVDAHHRLFVFACFSASAAFLLQDLFSFTVVGYGSLFWVLLGFGPAMTRTFTTPRPETPVEPTGKPAPFWGWIVLPLLAITMTYMSFHAVKVWVADSFYKQGQIGNKIGRWDYAVQMLQKAAGRLKPLTAEQVNHMLTPASPTPAGLEVQVEPGLSPNQELYWVKLGIAFEAGAATQPVDKMENWFLTALALHQHTLEMSPYNGYNYNNKARVLKTMGEKTGKKDYFARADDHYKKSLGLDPNNFYFNIEAINNLINLNRMDEAYSVANQLVERFPDVALPYSYRGFVELKLGKSAEAIASFTAALPKDWKGDMTSKALAANNLALLYSAGKNYLAAAGAYAQSVQAAPGNPEYHLNLARTLWAAGKPLEACQAAQGAENAGADPTGVAQMKLQMGCK